MMTRSRRVFLGLCAMAMVALVTGCSTLGISKVDDLQAAETRLANQNTSTNAEVKSLKQDMQTLQDWNAKQQASMDSLLGGITEMRQWISALNVDDIAQDASYAKDAALKGEQRWSDILGRLVTNLRAQQESRSEQLLYLESLWNALQINMEGAGGAPQKDEAAGSEGSDDSGG